MRNAAANASKQELTLLVPFQPVLTEANFGAYIIVILGFSLHALNFVMARYRRPVDTLQAKAEAWVSKQLGRGQKALVHWRTSRTGSRTHRVLYCPDRCITNIPFPLYHIHSCLPITSSTGVIVCGTVMVHCAPCQEHGGTSTGTSARQRARHPSELSCRMVQREKTD